MFYILHGQRVKDWIDAGDWSYYTQYSNSEQSFIGQLIMNKQIGEWSACLWIREHDQLSAPWAHVQVNTVRCLKTNGRSKLRHPELSSLYAKNENTDLVWKGILVPTQPVLTGKFPSFQEYRLNRNETIQQCSSRNETIRLSIRTRSWVSSTFLSSSEPICFQS
jgi:hypothetical protein